jgi:hypothetical protein
MSAAIVGLVAGLGGLGLGYLFRLTEFRREQRLLAYGNFVGAFLTAAHSGAALLSTYMALGEAFFTGDRSEDKVGVWATFGAAAQTFEAATGRLRLVASPAVLADSEVLENFIADNIRQIRPGMKWQDLGATARTGPAAVDREAVQLARLFANRAHGEITRWRSKAKKDLPKLAVVVEEQRT